MSKRKKPRITRTPPPTWGPVVSLFAVAAVISLFAGLTFYFAGHSDALFWQHASAFIAVFIIIAVGATVLFVFKAVQLYLFRRKGRELDKARRFTTPAKKKQ
ncbi:MAG TPA: hypothetical protein PKW95_01275 [bacterium]|nr:hypothetical protein [bacterium]